MTAVQEPTTAAPAPGPPPPRPRLAERIIAAINRDPLTAPHAARNDALLALATATHAILVALLTDEGRRPDALGWTLLLAAQVPLVWRRRRPMLVLFAVVALIGRPDRRPAARADSAWSACASAPAASAAPSTPGPVRAAASGSPRPCRWHP
ncbi:hypothetical protein GCM10009535_53510 [Streptomyces thermocarboxydovorans]|uniref:Uncharacterized protein n=1 Tax=Streptomyces thermocarboxydovorans TaxID=59298 RepID=A0ABP3SYG0_9ACTN